jgi:hypothetical protein
MKQVYTIMHGQKNIKLREYIVWAECSVTVIMGGNYSNHCSLLQQVVYVLATELPMVNSCQLLGDGPLLIK